MLSRAIFEKFKKHFEKGSGKKLELSGIGKLLFCKKENELPKQEEIKEED